MTHSARRPRRPSWPIAAGLLVLPLCAQEPFQLPPGAVQNPEMPADKDPKTTDSGLQYSVLTPGKDEQPPKLGDLVSVHYTGFLTDGTVFDSSRTRGEPARFVLGRVIEGWNEGVQLMTPGARFKLTIPAALAYGENGRPPKIPANATLVFDVELLEVAFRAPEYRKPDPDAQKTTESGLKCELLSEGEGDAPAADDMIEMKFSFWTTDGTLIDSTGYQPENLKGKIADFSLPFLKEALVMMKPGSSWRFEVPESIGFPMQPGRPPLGDTTWKIDLVRVIAPLPVPKFVAPSPDKLQKTDSGLQYEVIEAGEGESPKLGQEVEVHYAGWLADGTLFDSSYGRGDPATFMLGRVIPGWNEGLQLMKPGATYRFVIPPELAYGAQGSPPAIGPNATLIFQVKLLKVP